MPTLYLVATPIGNLGDMTVRAVETLRAVDVIASEDTRTTGRLLKHFEIETPQIAFHEHNEAQAGARIMGLLREGKSVAIVSEAGTPGISDPGFTIVRSVYAAQDAGEAIDVTMIPGAAAVTMALVLSGLPVHSFTFRGFPPAQAGRTPALFGRRRRVAPYPHLLRKPLSGRLISGRCAGDLWRSPGGRVARADQAA